VRFQESVGYLRTGEALFEHLVRLFETLFYISTADLEMLGYVRSRHRCHEGDVLIAAEVGMY